MFVSCLQALQLLKEKPITHKSQEYNWDLGMVRDSTWIETILDYKVYNKDEVWLKVETNGRVHEEHTKLRMIYFDMTRLDFVNKEDKPKYWDIFYGN